MPKPTTQIVSLGSIWLIDETEMKYCRLPRTEGPRQSPPGADWGGPGAGELQDNVWLDFITWRIDRGSSRLVIQINEDKQVSAPLTR